MRASSTSPLAPLVYQDHEHLIAVCGNAILSYSLDGPNPQFLEAWARMVGVVVDEWRAPLLILTMIDRRARAPDDASKRKIRETVLQRSEHIHAFAYVVLGEGFAAAAVRSAISLISLAARYRFPQKVFASAEDAVPWMLSQPSSGDRRAPLAEELISSAHVLSGQLKSVAAAG